MSDIGMYPRDKWGGGLCLVGKVSLALKNWQKNLLYVIFLFSCNMSTVIVIIFFDKVVDFFTLYRKMLYTII